MNFLYLIHPDYSPEVGTFWVSDSSESALQEGIRVAVQDLIGGWGQEAGYGSPTATVYLVAKLTEVGTAHAADAPDDWNYDRHRLERRLDEHLAEEVAWGQGDPLSEGGKRIVARLRRSASLPEAR